MTPTQPLPPKVFISYSHESPEHEARVLEFSNRRTIGLHFAAAQAIGDYIEHAGLTSGPLFRPRLNPRSRKLADRAIGPSTLYLVIESYLERLPGAI